MSDTIKLIECMTSWQGEGPDTGRRMLITRFKTCNRVCRYCDTMVKMRISLESDYNLIDLQKTIDEESAGLMITGGEPTFGDNFNSTLDLLTKLRYPIANVESNGYALLNLIEECKKISNINKITFLFSPKFFSQEELNEVKKMTTDLMSTHDNVFIKLVCEDNALVNDYLHWLDSYLSFSSNLGQYPHQRVFLMPEGRTHDELIKNSSYVFDKCEEYKFGFTSREHIIYSFI